MISFCGYIIHVDDVQYKAEAINAEDSYSVLFHKRLPALPSQSEMQLSMLRDAAKTKSDLDHSLTYGLL